jgi:hypothetical protein
MRWRAGGRQIIPPRLPRLLQPRLNVRPFEGLCRDRCATGRVAVSTLQSEVVTVRSGDISLVWKHTRRWVAAIVVWKHTRWMPSRLV